MWECEQVGFGIAENEVNIYVVASMIGIIKFIDSLSKIVNQALYK